MNVQQITDTVLDFFGSSLPAQALIERLGWTLLHSSWQFAGVAFVLWVGLRGLKHRSAELRYLCACGAFLAAVLICFATFSMLRVEQQPMTARTALVSNGVIESDRIDDRVLAGDRFVDTDVQASGVHAPTTNAAVHADLAVVTEWSMRLHTALTPWLPTIVLSWLAGVAVLSARPFIGWHTVRRLRCRGTSAAPAELVEFLGRLVDRMGLRRGVAIVQSALVDVPAVVGYLRPVVLMPASAVTGLPMPQLEALLAHELAHIQRHDYLVNLLQTMVETLFFYHPAVWWISRRMRVERENCCDDAALAVCGDRIAYTEALVKIEEARGPRPSLALSAADGPLLARIRRLAGHPPHDVSTRSWWPAGVAGLIVALVVGLGAIASSPADATTESAEQTAGKWGPASNGLRCRVVPVSAEMSADAIDLGKPITEFERFEDLAFAVELENLIDYPIDLLDTRYRAAPGEAKGPHSDGFGQFLFSIDYYDEDGRQIGRPNVQLVDLGTAFEGMLVATIGPGGRHRMLLRPAKWLSVMTQQLEPGKFQAAIRYHGLLVYPADQIRRRQPEHKALDAWSGNAASTLVAFEILSRDQRERHPAEPVWGEASNGMRAALRLSPRQESYAHGTKPDVKLLVQNASKKPITLSTHLLRWDTILTARDAEGAEVRVDSASIIGWVVPAARVTLQSQQTTIIDAGNLGIAATGEQADAFEEVTNRKLVVPAGTYSLQLSFRFGKGFPPKDSKGNVLAPPEGAWQGALTTGFAPVVVVPAEELLDEKQTGRSADDASAAIDTDDVESTSTDETTPAPNGEFITPAGICLDGEGGVLEGVEVVLYRFDQSQRREKLQQTQTDAEGRFRLAAMPSVPEKIEKYGITARMSGRVSRVMRFPTLAVAGDKLHFSMPKASTLRGRVLSVDGERIQGAKVFVPNGFHYDPVVGVKCALTDENGDYEITDVASMTREEWFAPKPIAGGNAAMVHGSLPRVHCRHPNFEYKRMPYEAIPGIANFLLEPAAVIDGRVVYADSGEAAPGVVVVAQSTIGSDATYVVTDEQGRYTLRSLRSEPYNIWTEVVGWTAPAIDSVQATTGETRNAPDVRLVRGGIIKGRLVDADTGEPISYAELLAPTKTKGRPIIAVKGPVRPLSGSGQMAIRFDRDGSYQFRVPPGEHSAFFIPPRPWKMIRPQLPELTSRVEREFDRAMSVTIGEGETLEMDFEIRLAE